VIRRLGRLALTALACAAMVLGLGLAPQSTVSTVPTAQAADLGNFNPGLIISDAMFYNTGTMSAAQIQTFLNTKGANCRPAAGNTCLKDYGQATTTRAADTYCAAYQGSGGETAAQIIAKVAVACGINPQVLIVTLQKEQGLITSTTGKSATTYSKALGFGCPDGAPCNELYSGFGNQVYLAARQFKVYAGNPTRYAHRAGMVNNVRFHPNAACGTSPVLIQNQATASLYNYTPYQPNAAALAAGYGSGDSCSSYGNRNFWNYFTDWFGSTISQQMPIGVLEAVTSPSLGTVSVAGWARDPDTTDPISVHVYIDGQAVTAMKADKVRSDVGRYGFSGTVKASGGTHQVCVWAIDATGGPNPQLGCATVTVNNKAPVGSLDAATSVQGKLRVQGWALDPDTTDSIKVHLYVDGKYTQQVVASGTRNDVAAAYGKGAAHGFDVTLAVGAGAHRVCAYGIDTSGGVNPQLGCRDVTVVNNQPIGALDSAKSGLEQFTIQGWALDPDGTDSIKVHVYVDGKYTRQLIADQARQDVANAYGKGAAHGYSATIPATIGKHELCVYGIDTWGGVNPKIACRTVDVNGTPKGTVDSYTSPAAGQVRVEGWTFDPNTTDPITVHVYVDGRAVKADTAGLSRPDVHAAFGMGEFHGFDTRISGVASGQHQVCVFAIDSWGPDAGGVNPQLGCGTVTVK